MKNHPENTGRVSHTPSPNAARAVARLDVARVCAHLRAAPPADRARAYGEALPILGDLAARRLLAPAEAARVADALGATSKAELRALGRRAKRYAFAALIH